MREINGLRKDNLQTCAPFQIHAKSYPSGLLDIFRLGIDGNERHLDAPQPLFPTPAPAPEVEALGVDLPGLLGQQAQGRPQDLAEPRDEVLLLLLKGSAQLGGPPTGGASKCALRPRTQAVWRSPGL